MKSKIGFLLFLCALCCQPIQQLLADTVLLSDGRKVSGTILQTNENSILLLTDFGTLSYARSIVTEIHVKPAAQASAVSTNRISDSQRVISSLSKQLWATDLKQIPATVIDNGVLKNVPYISFRCGNDYEVNIYGDLDQPAGIEAGVYRGLLNSDSAKSNCLRFVNALLGRASDRAILQDLNLEKDLKRYDGLTFEITPPAAPDAYAGWWISVYSESKLSAARASDSEMNLISEPRNPAHAEGKSDWTAEDLKLARPSPYPSTITFTDKSGNRIVDAEVVSVKDGVSLIWRKDASGGILKLANLPEPLRSTFGYDQAKTAAAEAAEKDKKDQEAQLSQARAAQAAQALAAQNSTDYGYGGSSFGSGSYTTGRVYVRGYYRKDGTYVSSYTRSYPHRH